MAKATDLAKTDAPQAIAQVPANLRGGMMIEGRSKDTELSKLAVFQASAEEDLKYPGHTLKRGDFFDVLEVRKLGATIKVLPVFGWASWIKFVDGEKAPVYATKNRSEVPTADLQWNGDTPPAANECINMVVVVEGEPWPYLFVLKRTALEAFERVIGPMESRRGLMGRGPGMYELGNKDAVGTQGKAKGKPYKRLTARFCGEPTPEMLAMASTIREQIGMVQRKAEAMADEDRGDAPGDNEIPI